MNLAVRNRRELAQHLQDQMVAARMAWSPALETDEEGHARTSVKTYLIEAHRLAAESPSAVELLRQITAPLGMSVDETEDSDLFRLRNEAHDFWCDTSMGRYWRLHTTAKVEDADIVHRKLVGATPLLDNVWLPPTYLEALADRTGSAMQTFSLNHDRRALTSDLDLAFVALRLWASHAARTLQKLREAQLFPHGVSLRSVKLRAGDTEPDGDFCIAEYFHNGKVTANGTSFDEHNRVLLQVLRDYGRIVERIEHRYAIDVSCDENGCGHLMGDPIVIDMDWTMSNLEHVVGRMFSATEPFRLWGVPERIAGNHFRARAVDLHVGSTLTFDITDKHIVIQLRAGRHRPSDLEPRR
ncbi:MAG: hypothetical protein E6J91_40855 [Deltaproteobacteria bacterium]|nr:MAG: hypothetical protein E6J91_40855 [Deltaproteobacteria bacterium]